MQGDFTGTDRFIIERQLGAGSMGAVYLAYDRQLESRVALKALLSVDATNIYRFKAEFRALADVTHPNLVSLHELFSQGDRWFFTMQYVQGKDLLSYVHGVRRRTFDSSPTPLPGTMVDESAPSNFEAPVKGLEILFPSPLENEDRLRAVLTQVVMGLQAVHAAGKLHRDLKPENVLVTPEGHATVLDFGIVMDQHRDSHDTLATIIGTPAYMSPEQCRGRGIGEATDWYALGVILYEALTGDVPFDGPPTQVISRKQEVDPIAPSEVVSGVSEDLNSLCMQLLRRVPAERPGGDAILRALRSRRAASVPAPAEAQATPASSTPFVGRDAQLRELTAARSLVESGQPVLVLIHGPAGIGKTTLVTRFINEVLMQSESVVLSGRCYERESLPFKAFDNVIDSVTRYLRKLPAVDAARMLPRDIDALAEIFPVLKRVEVVRRNRRTRPLPPEPLEVQRRAFHALKEMFGRIADIEPLVVYIDDLQWCDVDSAKLLLELVTGQDRCALMLVCAYRSGEDHRNSGLPVLLDQVRSVSGLQVRDVTLGVLGTEDSAVLAGQLLGTTATEEGARKLGFESGGNPQMLMQLVRHVEERRASGSASRDTAKGLITFGRVMEQQLASLSTDARTLLELLSVAARPVPESILTLVSSFNIDLSTALAELRGAKLVRGVAVHNVRAVEVYHDTIRESVTANMAVDVLVSWHRRLAAALEASGAIDLEALTDHLLGAGDRERASLYAARAGAQAEKGLAFDKAARLYGVAAEHCPDARRRRELLRHWADALVSAGRGAAAARAYVEAAEGAEAPMATELTALAGVQLLLAGELQQGLKLLTRPLLALNVELPTSSEVATSQVTHLWRELRARGFAFAERKETELDPTEVSRLDLLWGVTRGLLLHETDRPLSLVARCVLDALELGEPLRIVRALALFHVHVDSPLSKLAGVAPSGALDVAEALARRLDQVEGRAAILFAKGMGVYEHGKIDTSLQMLSHAEELYRNHCRGGAYEMRLSRMVIAQLTLVVQRERVTAPLREWIREAEDRADRVSAVRLRLMQSVASLRADDADAALSLLDAASHLAGAAAGTTALMDAISRGYVQLYRGNFEGCRLNYYLLDEFFVTRLASVPVWRALVLLLRARLALVARGAPQPPRSLLADAESAVNDAAQQGAACFADDIELMRASIDFAQEHREQAIEKLNNVLGRYRDRIELPLTALFAMRAKGLLLEGVEGTSLRARAEDLLVECGIANPRRFARLFIPGIVDLRRPSRSDH